jgi:hypothetical protein
MQRGRGAGPCRRGSYLDYPRENRTSKQELEVGFRSCRKGSTRPAQAAGSSSTPRLDRRARAEANPRAHRCRPGRRRGWSHGRVRGGWRLAQSSSSSYRADSDVAEWAKSRSRNGQLCQRIWAIRARLRRSTAPCGRGSAPQSPILRSALSGAYSDSAYIRTSPVSAAWRKRSEALAP